VLLLSVSACELGGRSLGSDNGGSTPDPVVDADPRYLYVASGACYGGGVTLSAGSGYISKYDLETGALVSVVTDYNRTATADLPADILEFDEDYLMVLVENATTTTYRRVDLLDKSGERYPETLSYGIGTFTGILRSLAHLSDGSTLVSRSTAIPKFDANFGLTSAAHINAPPGACATSTTLLADMIELPTTGKLLFAHAAATPNNNLWLMSADGTSCLAAQAAPITTALPTDILLHSSGRVLVSYGSTTAASNTIFSYVINETTNTFTTAAQSYSNSSYVNGPTRMVEDTETGDVYIANGTSTFNSIEKFSYNATSMALTRKTNVPFIQLGGLTRCISGMVITE
jgi:hypothetical protein